MDRPPAASQLLGRHRRNASGCLPPVWLPLVAVLAGVALLAIAGASGRADGLPRLPLLLAAVATAVAVVVATTVALTTAIRRRRPKLPATAATTTARGVAVVAVSPAAERPPAVGAAAGPERAEQRDPLLDLARAMPAGGWTPRPRTHPKAAALVHVLPRLLSEVPDGPLHTFLAGLVARHAASGLPKGFVVPTWVITVVAPAQAENEREPGSLPTVDWATLTPIGRAEATKAGCVIDVPRLPDRVAEPEPGARAWVDAVVAHVGKHAADPYVEEPKPLGSACLAIPFATTAQTARRRLAVRGTVIVQRLTTTWANAPWTVVLSLASHAATHLTVCDPDQGQPHPPVVRLDPEASTTAILAGGPERSLAARVLATAMRAHPERFQS